MRTALTLAALSLSTLLAGCAGTSTPAPTTAQARAALQPQFFPGWIDPLCVLPPETTRTYAVFAPQYISADSTYLPSFPNTNVQVHSGQTRPFVSVRLVPQFGLNVSWATQSFSTPGLYPLKVTPTPGLAPGRYSVDMYYTPEDGHECLSTTLWVSVTRNGSGGVGTPIEPPATE